jgi:hypothetical protein
MVKIRNPKAEIRKKSEIRNPKSASPVGARSALRASDFGFLSDFGLRISDFLVFMSKLEKEFTG